MNNFTKFKKEFTKWQNKFGLNNYIVCFEKGDADEMDAYADIIINQPQMRAIVRFSNDKIDGQYLTPEEAGKHEAIHLLLGRMSVNGKSRYVSYDDYYEAEEELVNRLYKLL